MRMSWLIQQLLKLMDIGRRVLWVRCDTVARTQVSIDSQLEQCPTWSTYAMIFMPYKHKKGRMGLVVTFLLQITCTNYTHLLSSRVSCSFRYQIVRLFRTLEVSKKGWSKSPWGLSRNRIDISRPVTISHIRTAKSRQRIVLTAFLCLIWLRL